MILTCPSCSTRYMVDPSSLGEEGRMVRCAKCSNQWHQEPPEDMPARVDTKTGDEIAAMLSSSHLYRSQARRSSDDWLGWAGLASIVILILAGAFLARDVIVELWPPATNLYALAGIPVAGVASAEQPLTFRNIRPQRIFEGDLAVLLIEGEIVNMSQGVADLPQVRVVLRGDGLQELASWTFQPTEMRLVPNEIIRFETRYRSPPDSAAEVSLSFTDRRS